ncbi:abasic site processing protein HMCES [Haematobia irritans]|uniref:abasic site processing protein HMCES n=1 Tax=Haematobia irritans TaxID=7368 RepID=UPI003F50B0ED
MCGRTCLTLEPQEIVRACRYKKCNRPKKLETHDQYVKEDNNATDDFLQPEWRSEFNCGRKFVPSYNMAPADVTPVMVSKYHFYDDEDAKSMENNRVIVPMLWGMIPFWHKGDYRKHGLTTNNCRLEHMLNSKLYRGPFRRGQRCAVVCEGLYEWQTTKSAKPSERAAYFLYRPQKEQIKIYDRQSWMPEDVNLLKMAGLFDVWEDEQGDKIYSYTIITFESSKIMSWLHHRMPAILETEEQLNTWLDFKNVTDEQALATLRPCTQLEWHQVSNLVNNSRNKSEKCNKPLEMIKVEKPTMNKMMSQWLNVRKRREASLPLESDNEGDEDKCPVNSGGGGTTTSESESELYATKRPRYQKRSMKKSPKNEGNSEKDIANTQVESP